MTAPATPPRGHRPRALIFVVVSAVLFGLVATVLGVVNAVAIGNESDEREEERIASDLAGCERGNVLRTDVRAIGAAGEALVDGILDEVLAGARDQAAADALRARLEPLFEEHRAAVESVELVDCVQVTPGINATTTTTEPNR